MTRGTPIPTEILMKAAVFPTAPPSQTEDKAATGNVLAPKAKGPYRRYDISYAINPPDIAFLPTGGGKVRADFELIVLVFDPDGAVVNSASEHIHVAAPREELIKAAAHGIQYSLQVSAPAKGEYFFRIAVHDINLDHYGAVEVATSSVSKLTRPAAPPPPPAK